MHPVGLADNHRGTQLPAGWQTLAIGGGAPADHRESELSTLVRARSRSTVAAAACSPTRSVSIFHSSSSRPSRIMVRIVSSARKARELRTLVITAPSVSTGIVRSAMADTWSRRARCSASSSTRRGRRFELRLRVHGEPALDHVARDGEPLPLGQHPHASPVAVGAGERVRPRQSLATPLHEPSPLSSTDRDAASRTRKASAPSADISVPGRRESSASLHRFRSATRS